MKFEHAPWGARVSRWLCCLRAGVPGLPAEPIVGFVFPLFKHVKILNGISGQYALIGLFVYSGS